MSFKMAAFIAAILAGLIPINVEAIELDVPNNSSSIETVFSNQEFNSLGEQVILAKAEDGFLPGAEGFTPTHIQKPVQNHNGLFGTKKNGSVKESINKDNPGNNFGNDRSNTPFWDSEINSDLKENRPESKNFEHQIYEKISENDTDV
jgi:hypothetical protein